MYKLYLHIVALCALVLCACDLQPKIASIPDNIGMFIETRYPALLADPQSQPEIYNSAVTDYGVYASPELYGSSNIDDYVLYASVDDYVLVPEEEVITVDKTEINTKSEQEEIEGEDEDSIEQEIMSEYLIVPVYGGNTVIDEIEEEKIQPKPEEKKEEVKQEKTTDIKSETSDVIVVERGDTLYSLAKKNNTTIAELAKINNLKEPYTLSVGQKLSTRMAKSAEQQVVKPVEKPVPNVISEEKVKEIKAEKAATTEKKVIKETVKPNSTKRVDVTEITVAKGDTLYSLSRKYQIPVNDLAIMNKLSAPFNLSVGQKLKVPKLAEVQTKPAVTVKKAVDNKKTVTSVTKAKPEKQQIEPIV